MFYGIMESIAGYIIVRKPLYDFLEPLTDSKLLEPVAGIYYNGLDRLNWYDVDTLFFDGMIPENLLKLYEKLGSSDNDLTNIKLLKDIDEVNCFVSIDKDILIKNEVIVISSPFLNKRKGNSLFSLFKKI